jgi:hypothetical protein
VKRCYQESEATEGNTSYRYILFIYKCKSSKQRQQLV